MHPQVLNFSGMKKFCLLAFVALDPVDGGAEDRGERMVHTRVVALGLVVRDEGLQLLHNDFKFFVQFADDGCVGEFSGFDMAAGRAGPIPWELDSRFVVPELAENASIWRRNDSPGVYRNGLGGIVDHAPSIFIR